MTSHENQKMRDAWGVVKRVEKIGQHCTSCQHSCVQTYARCTLGAIPADHPQDCPGYDEMVERAAA